MEPIWSATRDTKEAAALSTFGVPIRIDKAVDSKSGREYYTFYLGAKTESAVGGVGRLRKLYRERKMSEAAPDHPLLWCLVVMRNRERLLDLANKGHFMRPARLTSGQYLLRKSDQGLPGIAGVNPIVKVTEMAMAASLITLGVELLGINGPHGARVFYFRNTTVAGAKIRIENVHNLILQYRATRLAAEAPEHPLLYCMLCLHNRNKLLQAMKDQVQMVIVQKKNSPKSALIRADASDASWDRVQQHFGV
jgi:hypothetical protein